MNSGFGLVVASMAQAAEAARGLRLRIDLDVEEASVCSVPIEYPLVDPP